MKNVILLFSFLVCVTTYAQKKERIKGSKVVSVTQREIEAFDSLEVEDNLEVFLIKGEKPHMEIEADDNVHDAIKAEINGGVLRLYTGKEIVRTEKLSIKLVYTESLKSITTKHEAVLNALSNLEVTKISIKNLDYSKSYLNIRTTEFTLAMDDKSYAEINVQTQAAELQLSKYAELKALIGCPAVKCDMYQKSEAEIEGDTATLKLRLDNEASFTGKRFNAKNIELTTEGYSKSSIAALETIVISASGESEVSIYGKPANISFSKFADTAVVYKKEL